MNWLGRRSVLLLLLLLAAACGNDSGVDLGPGVTGTVTDAATNIGLAGVTITVGGRQGISNANGSFFISEVNRGTQLVTATKEGYARYSAEVTIGSGDITEVKIAMTRQ